jgi:uncharacterized protein YciI
MLFVVYCKDKPGDLRGKLRGDHLRHVLANAEPYRFGGPLLDAEGRVVGSVILFEFENRAQLDANLAADPYFRGGLFESVEIHETRQVVPELRPGGLKQEVEKEFARQGRG